MADVRIAIECGFEATEADGSLCRCCGDQCFLGMWVLTIYANGKVCDCEPKIVLCSSCHDAMESAK